MSSGAEAKEKSPEVRPLGTVKSAASQAEARRSTPIGIMGTWGSWIGPLLADHSFGTAASPV